MKGRRLHLIAIGGAGMSAVALVCDRLGAQVTGSDRSESTYVDRLRAAGLAPSIGHDAANVPEDADVVVSSAIPENNVELVRARERGQRVLHRSELLSEICAMKRLIAVAGAHGKTSTAGMLVQMLRGAGADPAFLLGGELPGAGTDGGPANAGWGEGEWIIAEADESDGSFLRLKPEVAVVTNIELDHHSHWAGERELWRAFEQFTGQAAAVAVPAGARFDAVSGGGEQLRFALAGGREAAGADLIAEAVEPQGSELRRFALAGRCGGSDAARLGVPGEHNVANALAAIAACELASNRGPIPPRPALLDALAEFPGMARRLEHKGEVSGALIYDDYAHHPTEVAASLRALRDDLDPKRLIAVFQPHLYSRTKALARRFGEALAIADQVGVLDVYAAREVPEGDLLGVSGRDVARAAAEFGRGKPVLWLRDLASAQRVLAPRLGPGDLLVTIGAGDIGRLADALVGSGAEV